MSASPIILLPAEIIASIAREVQPQDLKNFVLTCKAIYLASQDVLKVYRELRKQYRHVGNARKWDNSQVCYHLPELLQRVLESPKLASHVERLSYIEDENDEYRAADFKQLFQDRLENLQISNPERQAWWSDTRENQYKPRANQLMVGLLLRHLPHLETFEWHSMRFRLDLTDLIRPVQLDRAGSRYPLPALKSVSFSAGRYGNVLGKITLKQVLPFLALPNVEHMNIQDFRYSDPPDDLDAAAVPLRGSNLRELVTSTRIWRDRKISSSTCNRYSSCAKPRSSQT